MDMEAQQHVRRQYVVFRVAEEKYGIPIEQVQEVIKSVDITRLPQMPSSIKGIIQLRERVIPIMSLRSHFGQNETEREDRRIVIVNFSGAFIGLEVDSVDEVLEIPAENIDHLAASLSGAQRHYVDGIGKIDDELIILLKLDHLLEGSERTELDEAIASLDTAETAEE